MADVSGDTATIIGAIFAVVFWIVAGVVLALLCKQWKEKKARERRRSVRRSLRARENLTANADNGPNFWQDDSDSEWDSMGSDQDYMDPVKSAPADPPVRNMDSFHSLRSENLQLNMFNRSFKEDGDGSPVMREATDYDNVVATAPSTSNDSTDGNMHHSLRKMSVRYERGKEITQIVTGTGSKLEPAQEETWRSSAYEDIEDEAFVPPSNRNEPFPATPATGDYLQAADALPSSQARAQVVSVCYEQVEANPETEDPFDASQPPGAPAEAEAIATANYENFEAEQQTHAVKPPPPSEPPPPADDDVTGATIATANYQNLGEQQPPPPSEPPPSDGADGMAIATANYENLGAQSAPADGETKSEDPFDASCETSAGESSQIATVNYENFEQQPQPKVQPPPPSEPPLSDVAVAAATSANLGAQGSNGALTVPDPRGAVVSVCYEDIGDLDAPEEGGGQTDPTSEDPFDNRESKPDSKALHLSMYENPEDYSDATLKKAGDKSEAAPTLLAPEPEVTEDTLPAIVSTSAQDDSLPKSVSAYQTGGETLDAGMSDVSMRSRALTITAGF